MANDFGSTARLGDRLEQMENDLRDFGKQTRRDLLRQLASLDLKDRSEIFSRITYRTRGGTRVQREPPLQKSITSKLRKRDGSVEALAWGFVRHGIFLEHGVGKGRPVRSPQANRAARPWLRPVLEPAVEELADLLENLYADIISAEVRIRIPGVIDSQASPENEYITYNNGQNDIKILIDRSFF